MQRLGSAEMAGMLELIRSLGESTDVDDLAVRLTTGIRSMIPADLASYNEVDPVRSTAVFVTDPAEAVFDGVQERFAAHLDDHPLVNYYAETGGDDAIKVSDFVTVRQWRATALYREVFAATRTDHLLSVGFAVRPRSPVTALALHRHGHDFDERHRTLLELLRPYLVQAHRSAEARELLGTLERHLERTGASIVVVDAHARVRHASDGAARVLRRYFDVGLSDDAVLPAPLRAFVRRPRRTGREDTRLARMGQLTVEAEGRRLVVRVVADRSLRTTLLLEDRILELSPTSLRDLGLTPREAEVLALVACGGTNREIAAELYVSPVTVKKHLEHVYDKLGVRSRTAAAAVALHHGAARDAGSV